MTLGPDGGLASLEMNGSEPAVVVLDYGQNVEGIPTFEIISQEGDTSKFEITYSETKAGLDLYMCDGPLPLAAAMDTYRVNNYNITGAQLHTNRLIQGAFRYQKLNLSSPGSLELSNVGVYPTTDTTPLTELPGSFNCSDEDFTRIWYTGARTVQLSEIPKNTIPNFWDISSEGAIVDSLAPQVLASSDVAGLSQYEVSFEVKPVKNGFGFMVLGSVFNVGIYVYCDITNGVISAYNGSTERDGVPLATASLNGTVSLGSWYSVHSTVATTDIAVSINGLRLLSFTQTSAFYGSFGLGASYGHSAVFRNLKASSSNVKIYSSSLTDESFLDDFQMGGNPLDTVVDGSRRDRIVYTGDLDISLGSGFASTGGNSYVHGSIALMASYQATPGFFIPAAKIQQSPLDVPLNSNTTGLIGYSFNFLTAIAQYYQLTGDAEFAETYSTAVTRMLDWAHSQVLPRGLLNISDASIGGDWNYYDPTQGGVITKFNMVYAYALQQSIPFLQASGVDTSAYEDQLADLPVTDGFAQDANALAILAGVTSQDHTAQVVLDTLASELYLPAGPLAFSSSTTAQGFARKISPYSSAYHLRAAFMANDTAAVTTLLRSLWAPMADPASANYTSCFWETLEADGTPGLGISTSLCHGWAAGPTAELSRNVLGIQNTSPGFRTWKVAPVTLGLEWAQGKYPTPLGDILVNWRFVDGLLNMTVTGPAESTGTVYLPEPMLLAKDGSVLRINGEIVDGTSFEVVGGTTFTLMQEKPPPRCVEEEGRE
ncbi:Six-hairpin glycosidase-like protein [Xylariomycetidae sp. FL2044]|nr:Six-hairpin glycosidase-like protein [Xylariomycetidae sp. FL2044]